MKQSFIKGLLALFLITGIVSVYAQNAAEDPQETEAAEENAKENITSDEESPNVESEKEGESTSTESSDQAEKEGKASSKGNIYSDGKVTYATSAAMFKLNAEDSLSTLKHIEYKIDDKNYQIYSEPFQLNNVEEGRHTITYRGVDKVGNKEPDNVYAVIIDNTAPEVVVSMNEGFYKGDQLFAKANASIELKASDRYSGVKDIKYALNGAGKVSYSDKIVFEKSGLQSVIYSGCDNVGNISSDKKFIVFIDNKAPEVTIKTSQPLSEINGKKYSIKENSFSLEAKDTDSGVGQILVKIDGDEEFKPYTTVINFSEEGDHKIEAKAIDNVGNESEVAVLEVIIDNNPPKTMIETVLNEVNDDQSSSSEESNGVQPSDESNDEEQESNIEEEETEDNSEETSNENQNNEEDNEEESENNE